MYDPQQVWKAAGQLLRAQVSEAVWLSTFQDIEALPAEPGHLRLRCPNRLTAERITSRFMALIRDVLAEIGQPDVDVAVEVDDHRGDVGPGALSAADPVVAPSAETHSNHYVGLDPGGLNPRYTFETFVRGNSNQFALAAAQRVAETPGRSYNPLFIYGPPGMGKTHLLHAIGHYVRSHYQHDIVRYVSTETFLNEYVDGIRKTEMPAFQRRYRDIDVLLIDDIQFMEGRDGLQEEFFHTFNSLHGSNKQIVISSDRMPDAIQTLEDRLRGRFKWGLITDIQPPDMETRLAILRNKAERDRSPVPADVLEMIATRVTTNIRALEGALIRVTAYASLNKVPISTHLAESLLADLLTESYVKPRTDDELLNEIATILGFRVDALCGKSRQRPLVTARQMAMFVFREMTDLSYPAIARLFGGRDHTTVIHSVEKVQRMMRERKQVFDQVNDLVNRLKRG